MVSRLLSLFKSKSQPDTSELVKSASPWEAAGSSWSNLNANIDDVLAKHGYKIYSEMMTDDQVKACVTIKKLGVTIGGWSVQPAVGEGEEGYEEAAEIADFVEWALMDMEGSVETLLKALANALVYGFSICEIVWKYIEGGPYDGWVGIKAIRPKDPSTITFKVSEYGEVTKLVQRVAGDTEREIPLNKVLLYTYDPLSTGKPQGLSDLRAAYPHWLSKRSQIKWRNVAAEKYACPTVVGYYPQGASRKFQEDLLNACKAFVTDTAIVVPEGARIELLEPKTNVNAPYDAAIDSCNKGIARAIFGQILATDEGSQGAGSYAQAKIHKGILGMFLDDLRLEIAEQVLKEQLVKRLVNFNYETSLYPEIILAPPDERDLEALSKVMDILLRNGVIDPSEPFIREEFGLPPKPEELAETEEEEPEYPFSKRRGDYNPDVIYTETQIGSTTRHCYDWKDGSQRLIHDVRGRYHSVILYTKTDGEQLKRTILYKGLDEAKAYRAVVNTVNPQIVAIEDVTADTIRDLEAQFHLQGHYDQKTHGPLGAPSGHLKIEGVSVKKTSRGFLYKAKGAGGGIITVEHIISKNGMHIVKSGGKVIYQGNDINAAHNAISGAVKGNPGTSVNGNGTNVG